MKQVLFSLALLCLGIVPLFGQTYMTKTGNITFNSNTAVEKIEAVNRGVSCSIDAATGNVTFKVLMKGFKFEKALMEEHFNENYVESTTYPKSTFTGKLKDPSAVKWDVDGTYKVVVEGNLQIKDKTNAVSAPGTITIKGGKATAVSTFNVKVADYNIKIPAAVKSNIAETVSITVNCEMAKI